jgi:hypothetical protein
MPFCCHPTLTPVRRRRAAPGNQPPSLEPPSTTSQPLSAAAALSLHGMAAVGSYRARPRGRRAAALSTSTAWWWAVALAGLPSDGWEATLARLGWFVPIGAWRSACRPASAAICCATLSMWVSGWRSRAWWRPRVSGGVRLRQARTSSIGSVPGSVSGTGREPTR